KLVTGVQTCALPIFSNGGVFVWKDGRENADTITAAFNYPQGFLYSYSTHFGNSYRPFTRILGTEGTIMNYGGEGSSLFTVTRERSEERRVGKECGEG